MAEELFQTLLRFHREIAVPDMERTIKEPLERQIGDLRNEMRTNSLERMRRDEAGGELSRAEG